MRLGFLRSDGGGFGLIEIATGYKLHHLLMGLRLLLHEGMDVGFLVLENLLDLSALVICEIERVQGEPHFVAAHEPAVHAHATVMRLVAFSLGEGEAGGERYGQKSK
jgi:hypothetical protein